MSWKRALIEKITWDCTGFCKIELLRKSFGKLPLSLLPDPQSISHPRPNEVAFILPEFLTLDYMVIFGSLHLLICHGKPA